MNNNTKKMNDALKANKESASRIANNLFIADKEQVNLLASNEIDDNNTKDKLNTRLADIADNSDNEVNSSVSEPIVHNMPTQVWADENSYGQESSVQTQGASGQSIVSGQWLAAGVLTGSLAVIGSKTVNTSGNDLTLMGYIGDDKIFVDAGNHTISGLEGNDTLSGGAGDDQLEGGSGNDVLYGGIDNDTIIGGEGADSLYGDVGQDQLYGGSGTDWLFAGTDNDTLSGGLGGDALYGNEGEDVIGGDEGQDTLYGGQGNDQINGGSDADTLYGEQGHDQLDGGSGADKLYGEQGDDLILGGDGNDTLDGGLGNDTLNGGGNDDTFVISTGVDTLIGGVGLDTLIIASVESHTVIIAADIATLTGASLPDSSVISEIENFNFTSNQTDEYVNIIALPTSGILTINAGTQLQADSVVYDSGITEDLYINLSNVTSITVSSVDSTQVWNQFEVFSFGNGNNTLIGGVVADTLVSGTGNDSLVAGGGNDYLDGGLGSNTLIGGTGNDLYMYSHNTLFTELIAQGVDTIDGSGFTDSIQYNNTFSLNTQFDINGVSFSYGQGTQIYMSIDLDYVTSQIECVQGSEHEDNLHATGNMLLNGQAGDDTLSGAGYSSTELLTVTGGAGNDIYIFNDYQHIIEGANQGIDIIDTTDWFATNYYLFNYVIPENVENLLLGYGTALIIGNSSNNWVQFNGAGNHNHYYVTDGLSSDTIIGNIDSSNEIRLTSTDINDLDFLSHFENFSYLNLSEDGSYYLTIDSNIVSTVFNGYLVIYATGTGNDTLDLTGWTLVSANSNTSNSQYQDDFGNFLYLGNNYAQNGTWDVINYTVV